MKKNIILLNRMNYAKYFDSLGRFVFNTVKYDIYLITKRAGCGILPGEFFKSVEYIDLNDESAIFDTVHKIAKNVHIDYVIALSETDQIISNEVRKCLELPTKIDDIYIFRDKLKMKDYANKHSIEIPDYCDAQDAKALLSKHGKIIIKPRLGSGAKDIFKIDNNQLLESWYSSVYKSGKYIAEEYVDYDIFHIDVIIEMGQIRLMNCMKYTSPPMDFKENSFMGAIDVSEKNILKIIKGFIGKVIDSYKLTHSVLHIEIFYSDGDIKLCEIACRPGGAGVVPLLEIKYGINLRKVHIDLELGEPIGEIRQSNKKLYAWGGFMRRAGLVAIEDPIDEDWILVKEKYSSCDKMTDEAIYITDFNNLYVFDAETKSEIIKKFQLFSTSSGNY